jgi:hypothetical protein
MREKVSITVILMMLWYSVAGVYHVMHASADRGFDLGHLDLHAHAVSHHHDDEGQVHQDQSVQSSLHMVMDGANAITAITVTALGFPPSSPSSVIEHQSDLFYEFLLVNLPFRPPRTLT